MKDGPNELAEVATYEGRIEYITDTESCQKMCETLIDEKVLGFDTEWKVMFAKGEGQRPTGLIQLSSPTISVLFHVAHYELSENLRYILESRHFKSRCRYKG
eukprot:UN19496